MNIPKSLSRVSSVAGLVIVLSYTGASHAVEAEFRYTGDKGPGFWSDLDPGWGVCAGNSKDARQSPIDIEDAQTDQGLKPLKLKTFASTIDIINNGHTIEQLYQHSGGTIYYNGKEYDLHQFHFHTLSEHAVHGKRGVMEMHAVFNEHGGGDNLVVSTLFQIGKERNPFIQSLINAGLPQKNGEETVSDDSINLASGLTNTSSYYTYAGSLTTPGCTENVTWIVLKEQAKLDPAQWESFRHIMGNNFRPLQVSNGRIVRATTK